MKSSSAENAQELVIEDEHKLQAERNADYQEKGEMRRPKKLPKQCCQNTQQRQRTQYEGNDGLQGYEQEEHGYTDALPESPEDAPAKIGGLVGRLSVTGIELSMLMVESNWNEGDCVRPKLPCPPEFDSAADHLFARSSALRPLSPPMIAGRQRGPIRPSIRVRQTPTTPVQGR